jgi:hypothetical protein
MMKLRIPIQRVSRALMVPALEALTSINEELLSSGRFPLLYQAGVRYQNEPPGQEDWDPADRVIMRGWGDCEDLAAWRAAELRLAGEDDARADTYVSRVRPDGSRVWHAITVRGDGTVEDPSVILGMRRHRGHARHGVPFRAVMSGYR